MNLDLKPYFFVEKLVFWRGGDSIWRPCLSDPDFTPRHPGGFESEAAAVATATSEKARYGGEFRLIRHFQYTPWSPALPRGWHMATETEPGRWLVTAPGCSNGNERFVNVAGVLHPFVRLDIDDWSAYAPLLMAMARAGVTSAPIVDASGMSGPFDALAVQVYDHFGLRAVRARKGANE